LFISLIAFANSLVVELSQLVNQTPISVFAEVIQMHVGTYSIVESSVMSTNAYNY